MTLRILRSSCGVLLGKTAREMSRWPTVGDGPHGDVPMRTRFVRTCLLRALALFSYSAIVVGQVIGDLGADGGVLRIPAPSARTSQQDPGVSPPG